MLQKLVAAKHEEVAGGADLAMESAEPVQLMAAQKKQRGGRKQKAGDSVEQQEEEKADAGKPRARVRESRRLQL